MKFKIILIFFAFGFSNSIFGQFIPDDSTFIFYLKKTDYKIKFLEIKNSSTSVSVPFDMKKIQIRFKVKSISGNEELFDFNKFSLVCDLNKSRYRPVDIQYHVFAAYYISADRLVSDQSYEGNRSYWVNYKKEIRDTFKDYSIFDYMDVEIPINFGTIFRPNTHIVFFDNMMISSKTIDFYFAVPKEYDLFKIYYGSEMIQECMINTAGF